MLSVDTNVVTRYLLNDDPDQSPKARDLVAENEIFFSVTVVLETAWVLRSVYRFATADIIKGIRGFAGLPTVSLEDRRRTMLALDWMDAGLDIADALHLSRSEGCEALLSFDRRFARRAKLVQPTEVRAP